MNKLVTFHSNSCKGVGGIESFLREIFKLLSEHDYRFIEIYTKEDTGQFYNLPTHVKIRHVNTGFKHNKYLQMLSCRKKISRLSITNSTIIIFKPISLIYFPFKLLKNNEVILVQSNSYSALFRSRYSKLIFRYLKRYINFITVYTELDKKIFSEVYPEDKIKVIPRGCRIQTANKTREFTRRLV